MKLIPNESWDDELFEITEILCILSMWGRNEILRIWISSYLEFLEGKFKQSFYL